MLWIFYHNGGLGIINSLAFVGSSTLNFSSRTAHFFNFFKVEIATIRFLIFGLSVFLLFSFWRSSFLNVVDFCAFCFLVPFFMFFGIIKMLGRRISFLSLESESVFSFYFCISGVSSPPYLLLTRGFPTAWCYLRVCSIIIYF